MNEILVTLEDREFVLQKVDCEKIRVVVFLANYGRAKGASRVLVASLTIFISMLLLADCNLVTPIQE